ncbi:MAG: hypothetical protein PHW76_01210, partial [Alphaproteobacteria bacterium]|nr:hypothetical protein [Alphaproteobacteria bacterium]
IESGNGEMTDNIVVVDAAHPDGYTPDVDPIEGALSAVEDAFQKPGDVYGADFFGGVDAAEIDKTYEHFFHVKAPHVDLNPDFLGSHLDFLHHVSIGTAVKWAIPLGLAVGGFYQIYKAGEHPENDGNPLTIAKNFGKAVGATAKALTPDMLKVPLAEMKEAATFICARVESVRRPTLAAGAGINNVLKLSQS